MAVFNIHAKENEADRHVRHGFMMDLVEEEKLVFKINPGKIDLYEAASDSKGNIGDVVDNRNIIREFVTRIDIRVKENLLNRVRMKLSPFEMSQFDMNRN